MVTAWPKLPATLKTAILAIVAFAIVNFPAASPPAMEMGQKGGDILRGKLTRMPPIAALAMKFQKSDHPAPIGVLGTPGQMFEAGDFVELLLQRSVWIGQKAGFGGAVAVGEGNMLKI